MYNSTVIHTSIIIVHYNTDQETSDCLDSLQRVRTASDHDWNVVVVDNGSKETFEYTGSFPEEKLSILRSASNLGFTGGNNLGIHHAIEAWNSDQVVLLNSDTTVDPDFLSTLTKWSQEHPRAGLVTPKIFFSPGREYHHKSYTQQQKGSVLWYAGGTIDWQHLVAFHRGVDELDRGQFAHQTDSEFATGCCVLIKREVLEKVGFFDKRYFLYMEDVDYSFRAHRFGYSIGYCDAAVVWHKNAGSSDGAGSGLHAYYQTRNRLLFFFSYGSERVRLTMFRVLVQLLLRGSYFERLGVIHYLIRQLGKQPVL